MKSFILILSLLLAGTVTLAQTGQVIICKGKFSERYHAKVCSGLNNCKGGLAKVTVYQAKEIGRTPCITCYGKTSTPVLRPSNTTPSGESNSGQCRATTKKGTRCSRSARSGGYCWQHE